MYKSLKNGTAWLDTENNEIHAHGGFMLQVGDIFYWYGEDRRDNYYVSCYASTDLMNWEFRNHILTTESKVDAYYPNTILLADYGKVNIERPKVIYNDKTQKYVMWAHYENGVDYKTSTIAVATCDTPDGNFTYHGCFSPMGNISRDCTLYKNKDGKVYFVSAAKAENEDLNVYLLTEDYMGVERLEKVLYPGMQREAPTFFEADGKLFLLTSHCTGWAPNQGGYCQAGHLLGDWSEIDDFGDDITYQSQPAFVLPLAVKGKKQYIYVGDRWGGSDWDFSTAYANGKNDSFDYFKSSYYFSLITVENNKVTLVKCDEFTIDLENEGFQVVK